MLKYIKNVYIATITSNFAGGVEGPRGEESVKEVKDSNNNGTNIDELYKMLEEAVKNEKDPNRLKKLTALNEQMQKERSRIESLHGEEKEKVKQVLITAVQEYSKDLMAYSQEKATDAANQEKIAATMQQVKEFNSNMREKAEQYINYVNNNPSAKANGVELQIEDGKVALYKNGKREKYFTIPTMKPNGEIKNQENLARINFYYKDGMDDFVKKYVPDVKTYAEVGQEITQKRENQEKVAKTQEQAKAFNQVILDVANKSVDFVKNIAKTLPDGIDLVIDQDTNRIQLIKGDKVLKFFTLNTKKMDGTETHPENNARHVYGNLDKWVKTSLKEKNIIPKNERVA